MSRSSGVAAGGGGGLANAYAAVTDGVNTANAVGADTIKVESTDNNIVPTAGNGAPDFLDLILAAIVRLDSGGASPSQRELIIGDAVAQAISYADIIAMQALVPDDIGQAAMTLFGADSAASVAALMSFQAFADGTVGASSANFTISDFSNQVLFGTNSATGVSFTLGSGAADNGGNDAMRYNDGIVPRQLAITGEGSLDLLTHADPAAPPPANTGRLYVRTAVTGNLELCLEYPSGLIVVLDAFDLPRPARYILPVAQAAVANLAVAGTTLFSTSVPPASLFPANSLKVGDIIRLRATGELFNNSGVAATMSIVVRIGGQNIYATQNPSIASAATSTRSWSLDLELSVQALGAFVASRFQGYGMSNISGANNRLIVLANSDHGTVLASWSTLANAALDVLATSSVNNAATTATLESLDVEYIPGT